MKVFFVAEVAYKKTMYTSFLFLHSLNRWFVLISLGLALVTTLRGLVSGAPLTRLEFTAQKAFIGAIDLQFVLGISVLGVSPLIAGGNIHPWVFQHVGGMIIAIAIAHTFYAFGRKRATLGQTRKMYLLGDTLAMLVILGSIPWPFSPFARPWFRGL